MASPGLESAPVRSIERVFNELVSTLSDLAPTHPQVPRLAYLIATLAEAAAFRDKRTGYPSMCWRVVPADADLNAE